MKLGAKAPEPTYIRMAHGSSSEPWKSIEIRPEEGYKFLLKDIKGNIINFQTDLTIFSWGGFKMIYAFDGYTPEIGEGTYVSETAIVIGNVKIVEKCYIGHGSILRGDYGRIEIGSETAIEEG